MKEMTNPPEEWKEAYEALKDMYSVYLKLTGLVVSPSGSLQTFSQNFNEADSSLVEEYNKLKMYMN